MYSVRARRPADTLPLHATPKVPQYSKTQGKVLHWWAARNAAMLLAASAIVVSVLVLAWVVTPVFHAWRALQTPDFPSEMTFAAGDGTRAPFGSLLDPPTISLSVVVPAYNEAARLPAMLDDMLAVLDGLSREATIRCGADSSASYTALSRSRQLPGPGRVPGGGGAPAGTPAGLPTPSPPCAEAFTWEVIVVDDGSSDDTVAVAESYLPAWGPGRLRVLRLHQNLGKGGAVRKGVLRARGAHVLFADADGATEAKELLPLLDAARRLAEARADGAAVAVGSRAHLSGPHAAQRSPLRRALGGAFHAFMAALVGVRSSSSEGGAPVQDTQCGFKIFSRHAAQLLLPALHIERWAFDVELLVLAARRRIPIAEVPVAWHEVPGSHVGLLSAGLQMARDVLAIRLCYGLGLWTDALPPAYLAAALQRGVHPSGAAVSRFDEARLQAGGPRAGAGGHPAAPAAGAGPHRRAPAYRPAPVYRDALYHPPPPAQAAGQK